MIKGHTRVLAAAALALSFAASVLPAHAATATSYPLAPTARPDAAATDPTSGRVFLANFGGPNGVIEIDPSTNLQSGFLAIPGSTRSIAIDSTSHIGYVATSGGVRAFAEVGSLPMQFLWSAPTNSFASGVAVDEQTHLVYVTVPALDQVAIFTPNLLPITTVSVGSFPHHVAVNSHTHCAYVGNMGSNNVSVICLSSEQRAGIGVVGEVQVGASPRDIAVNQNLDRVYTSNQVSGDVTAFEGTSYGPGFASTTYALTPTLGTYVHPVSINVNSNTGNVYIGTMDNEVRMLDWYPSTEQIGAGSPFPTKPNPNGIGINPATNTAYVTNFDGASITVIN